MIKERSELLEKFKQWFTYVSSEDIEENSINSRLNFIDKVGNEITFMINGRTLFWSYRLRETKEWSCRQSEINIDKKFKKIGIVKNDL